YRLELEISDDNIEAVVVMFDKTTRNLLKCFGSLIVGSEDQVYFLARDNLTNTLTDLRFQEKKEHSGLPFAFANIVGTRHTLELKSHTYYEHKTYESFIYWNVIAYEEVEKSASSGMVAANVDPKALVLRRLTATPSMATPSKPSEEKK
nr:hypothetical protein [Tanacetum cinerariifolium]